MQRRGGFTLLELLVVIAVLAAVTSVGIVSYVRAINPPKEIARTIYNNLYRIRTDAIENTQAKRVLLSGQDLILQTALRCSEADPAKWTNAGRIDFDNAQRKASVILSTPVATGAPDPSLPSGSLLYTCFTSRGLAVSPAGQNISTLTITDSRRTLYVDVALGGGVRTRGQ